MRFPLLGEPLALDLLNTRVATGAAEADLLDTPAALAEWLGAQGDRLPALEGRPTAADLEAVRSIRSHIDIAVAHARQGRRPPAGALRALTDAQRGAPTYRELDWDGTGVTAADRRIGERSAILVAELAAAATELLTSPDVNAVRQCEGPGCVLLFLPSHPRRRWCSPALCGNRVRVARYYRRHSNP